MPREAKLRSVINALAREHQLPSHVAFIYWFMQCRFGIESDDQIRKTICDGTNDCGIDAVYINDDAERAFVIQSKHTERYGGKITESDVRPLVEASKLLSDDRFREKELRRANASAKALICDVIDRKRRGYAIDFLLATTKRSTRRQFERMLTTAPFSTEHFALFGLDECESLSSDDERGFAPPTPPVKLHYKPDAGRLLVADKQLPATSWSFAADAAEVASLVRRAGHDQIFRKNVRAFLGGKISKRVRSTLKDHSQNFWFYNSGLTILADSVVEDSGDRCLLLTNAHIVNGCQTAMTIDRCGLPERELKSILVPIRVICPRCPSESALFVSELIVAQNTANPIKPRDLKSNDPRQLNLQRSFSERKYFLEIKRGVSFGKLPKLKRSNLPNGALSNELIGLALFACFSAIDAKKHKADLFDDSHYDRAFPEGASVAEYLGAHYLLKSIGESYKGAGTKRKFHEFTPRTFQSHTRLYALHLLWSGLRKLARRGWRTRLNQLVNAAEAESATHGGVGFDKAVKPVADLMFEVLYQAYKAGAASIRSGNGEDEVVEATPANFFINVRAKKFVDRAVTAKSGEIDKRLRSLARFLDAHQQANQIHEPSNTRQRE